MNKKKRRKIDWQLFITSEESQREMAELERLMVEQNEGLIFSSEQYLEFLEKHFNVSL